MQKYVTLVSHSSVDDGELAMKLLLVIVVASFVSFGGGLSAYAAESTAKKDDPNQKVCKRVKDTGSRLMRRVCLKRKVWTQMEEENKRMQKHTAS